MDGVTIRIPDDLHSHFRDGDMMRAVVPWTAKSFARALAMPNVPAIHAGDEAIAYRDRIEEAAGDGFKVLPCIKLTHRTAPDDIRRARGMGVVSAKLYPSGVTNASHDGIVDPWELRDVYGAMADCGMVLCIHGEAPGVFILDREVEYRPVVGGIAWKYPSLRVVLEHVTQAGSVAFVADGPPNLACTVTCHHLIHSLDDVLSDGIHPHHFCYPVAKRPEDRAALIKAALTCERAFFGSDTAPHRREDKESACGCAGVFSAPVALSVLAEVFLGDDPTPERVRQLQAFTSERGADFYGLPRNAGTITLERRDWTVPGVVGGVVPLWAGRVARWRVADGEGE